MAEADERTFLGLSDVSISEDIPVEGEITVPMSSHSQDDDYSTLDEPVKETIIRDLKAVGKKFVHVMYPKKSNALLRDWDLWGPLVLCVSLALMLQGGSVDSKEDGGPQFAEVFVIVWFGAVVITLNSKLLGGTISFFQSLCVLGYCVLPLTVGMLVCRLVLLASMGPINFLIRFIVVIAMFAWSTLGKRTPILCFSNKTEYGCLGAIHFMKASVGISEIMGLEPENWAKALVSL
ncbi:protein YIPF6 isoform X1 [Monodelphis domestica]|uniref:protein YIPF6 isoform X1 n=1 Tax=Monodelphis domestica TaxID=13616 RepID=UPI0024E1CB38|nr:protein YIPF6 isoform X1 [Monodelphis domestica]